jgi:hypothetical protein
MRLECRSQKLEYSRRDPAEQMASHDPLEDDYRELDLKPGASLEEVKSSYRELALFWHPDQYHDRPSRLPKAHQKMTRINLAYDRICKALAAQPRSRPAPARANTAAARPPDHQRPRETRTNSLGMTLVSVPGTSVLFSIWETRVQDYAAYAEMASGVDLSWKNPGFCQTASHPVVNVSWEDARKFCFWLTEKERQQGKLSSKSEYRLPTDSEWSWAVGIGIGEGEGHPGEKHMRLQNEYPWGRQWPPPKGVGNYDPSLRTDTFDQTSPVGSFAPNTLGLFDLGGNVWEWCEDFLDGSSRDRVLRGGSWNFSGPGHLLSSYRNSGLPNARSTAIGFRCVLEPL